MNGAIGKAIDESKHNLNPFMAQQLSGCENGDKRMAIDNLDLSIHAVSRRNSQLWWIQSVFVHPDYRRKGLYRALYRHIQACAAAEKACGIRLYADASNHRAQHTVGPPVARVCFGSNRDSYKHEGLHKQAKL